MAVPKMLCQNSVLTEVALMSLMSQFCPGPQQYLILILTFVYKYLFVQNTRFLID